MNNPKIVAVDFDGCLCSNKWPKIGEPNWEAIHMLAACKADGGKVILWTCREGKMLEEAVLWCLNRGLRFDAVNDNLPELKEAFGNNTRKVYADEYWDDRSVPVIAGVNPHAGHFVAFRKEEETDADKGIIARIRKRFAK